MHPWVSTLIQLSFQKKGGGRHTPSVRFSLPPSLPPPPLPAQVWRRQSAFSPLPPSKRFVLLIFGVLVTHQGTQSQEGFVFTSHIFFSLSPPLPVFLSHSFFSPVCYKKKKHKKKCLKKPPKLPEGSWRLSTVHF